MKKILVFNINMFVYSMRDKEYRILSKLLEDDYFVFLADLPQESVYKIIEL